MNCRIVEMKDKQVICIKDGTCLGCVGDIEVDTRDGRLVAIVIFGRNRLFGLMGREDDCIIPWGEIEVIGEDTILVRCDPPGKHHRRKGILPGFSYGANR